MFKVNIVSKHVKAKRMIAIVRFHTELKQTDLNSWYVKDMGVHKGKQAFASNGKWD